MRYALLIMTLGLATLAVAQEPTATVLNVEVPTELVQGESVDVKVTLTDAEGLPLGGELVSVQTSVPFFDYRGTFVLGEARTNFRGEASFPFNPTVIGNRRITAEFAGDDSHAPARAAMTFSVQEGVLTPAAAPPAPVLPWLTRGTATAVLLPAMLGVWVIFAYAIYQMTRIARGAPEEVSEQTKGRAGA